MARFQSAGVDIVFDGIGEGPPVVLVHGFAAHRRQAWRSADWYDDIIDGGREVLALDLRGHGESGKPLDPAAYTLDLMVGDVIGLLERCGIDRADMIGHSMGARLVLEVMRRHPQRVGRGVLIGVGERLFEPSRDPAAMANAMRARRAADVADEAARSFRIFAETTDADLEALACCTEAPRDRLRPEDLAGIETPTLVVAAGRDEFAGDSAPLAEAIPGARLQVVPGTAHHSVLTDPRTRTAVFAFLGIAASSGAVSRW